MENNELNAKALQEYVFKLEAANRLLKAENEALKKKQEAFQDELVGEIQKIEKLPFFKKIFSYGALLKQLIEGVMSAIDKAKAQK